MVVFFISCMMGNLAGDSVYQATGDDPPSVGGGVENSLEGEESETSGITSLEYTESDGFDESSVIVVDVVEDGIDVVHTNVDLGCDMSIYTPEVSTEGSEITVRYMPPTDDRSCMMDVQFSLDIQLENGEYTLILMEDETSFTCDVE